MEETNKKYSSHCTKSNRPRQPSYRMHQEFTKKKRIFYHNNDRDRCLGFGWTDGVVTISRHFKFFIGMENNRINGYNTEKLYNGFYAQSIPIYFGDPTITDYIEKKSFFFI